MIRQCLLVSFLFCCYQLKAQPISTNDRPIDNFTFSASATNTTCLEPRILFVSTPTSNTISTIWSMDTLGLTRQRLFNDNYHRQSLTINKQGTKLAYTKRKNPNNAGGGDSLWICLSNTDGTGEQTIYLLPQYANTEIRSLRFNSTGNKLLFCKYLDGWPSLIRDGDIFVMDLQTKLITQLTTTANFAKFAAEWSLDDSKISFTYLQTGWYASPIPGRMMNADGSNITVFDPKAGGTYGNTIGAGFSYIPDGSGFVFSHEVNPGGAYSLYRCKTDGTSIISLGLTSANGFDYSFTPDGQRLAVGDNNTLRIISLQGQQQRTIAAGANTSFRDVVFSNVKAPPVLSAVTANICQGQSFLGHTSTGIYADTFTSANGCDSVRSLTLTVKPRSFSTITQSICQGQSFLGHNASGVFLDTLVAANGCDSVRSLTLTVKPRSFSTITQSICQGQSFMGHSASGVFVDTLLAINGCDSIRTLQLTVKPRATSSITQSICQGQTYLGHSTGGIYIDTLLATNGCDSIRTLNLTVKPRSSSTIIQSICQSQSFLGHNTSGIYIDTLLAANGCDSIRTLNLTVKPRSSSTIIQSICQGQSFLGHNAGGIYIDTLLAANGCDSIRILQLTVKPRSSFTIIQSICQGQSFLGHSTSGSYTDTLIATNGCDSIRTLNLTVKPRSSSTITQSICQGQTYLGHSTVGIYIDTLLTTNGCDSIRTLNLTVKPRSSSTITQSICQGQSFLGHNASGTYTDTLVAANGCDSIRTLQLTVKPPSINIIDTTICTGQQVEGYTISGIYSNTFMAANGCDSIRTLRLTVLPVPVPFLGTDKSICEGDTLVLSPGNFTRYQWQNGSTQNNYPVWMPGKYWVQVWNANCNATDTFTLIGIYNKPQNFLAPQMLICKGSQLTVPGYANYYWSTGERTSSIVVKRMDTIWLQVTSFDGCTGLDNTTLIDKGCTLYKIPNAFSPNNDGTNDLFKPSFTQAVGQYKFRIFNRWGQQVFVSNQTEIGWDGKYKQQPVAVGVYYYIMEFKDVDGEQYERSGSVTLLR